MAKKLLVIFFLFISFLKIYCQTDSLNRIITPHVSPTLKFTENKGQWEEKILFRSQLDGGLFFIEKNCLTFNFYDKKKYRALRHGNSRQGMYKDFDIRAHAYKIHFVGANINPSVEKQEAGQEYENFFLGNDESKWRGGVKNYHRAWLRNLYPEIDYEIITASNGLKYNFHIKPNADVTKIALRYEGVNQIKIKDGALILKLEVNEVIERKPYAYQVINGKIKKINCNYKLKDNVLGFDFPAGYNKNYALVIDPVLVFAAQSGSTADNFGMTATFDPAGNLYSGGTVFDIGYPTTLGAYSVVFNGPAANGNTDVVITKYNSTGSNLLFSTYIGGSGTEIVTSLIVDKNDNLCFYGATGSSNFPTTVGAYDNTYNGGQFISFYYNGTTFNNGTDIYIGKFNTNGTALLACTFLGGSSNDGVNHVNHLSTLNTPFGPVQEYATDSLQFNYGDQYRGEIQLDPSNNIYIASSTRSSDFPTVNAFDNTLGGKQDAILAKFNSNLTTLLYCSFIGGSLNDAGYGLVVKNNFEVYITGGTCSNDFPFMSPGGYQPTFQGGKADGYVLRISPTGTIVLNGTYFGTNSYDQSYLIQTDKYDDVYIYGQSYGNVPVLKATNATTVFNVPNTHQFIARFDETLSARNMSTVFGNYTNRSDISPSAFSIDKCNTIYLSGWGGDVIDLGNFPLANMPLFNPTQSTTDGHDFYLMALDSNAANLLYGSYFGGSQSPEHVDGGTSRFDPLGKIYQSVCAGCGGNDDFPVTPGAWPNTPGNSNHSFNCNNGVFKVDFQIVLTISSISTNTLAGCAPFTANFNNAIANAPNTSYKWYLGNGVVTTTNPNPTTTYLNPGTYTVSLVVTNSTSCNKKDSSVTYITVFPTPTVNFSYTVSSCSNTIITTNTSVGNFGANPYLWSFGNGITSTLTSPSHIYPSSGNYSLSLTARDNNGCSAGISQPISIFIFTTGIVPSGSICSGRGIQLNASGGTNYTWTPAISVNSPFLGSTVANPTSTTIYTVQIVNSNAQHTCAATATTQVLVRPNPAANFSFTAAPCGGGANFTDLSTVAITEWDWRLASSVTSTVQNPYYFYATGGNYNIRLIVTNAFKCKDTLTKILNILTPPPLSVSGPTTICKGNTAQLSASGGTAYAWKPSQTLDFPNMSNPGASPQVTTEYSVVISTNIVNPIDGLPCTYTLSHGVTVTEFLPTQEIAQANPKTIITGSSTTLTYIGDPGLLITWLPQNSTKPATGYTVRAMPDKPTTYTAVATKGACRRDVEVSVDAFTAGCIDEDAFVPNTFTPNNDDRNDIFRVRGLKIDEIYFAVYNRWGEKVFETRDKNGGWDGVYKGKPADVGVFGWYLKVKCLNGEETFRKGNVTLIR